jgi:HAD superfamily hydrolase (TIGR01549 family)
MPDHAPSHRQIRWVFFDVGETLFDETRQWTGWARWLGVPPSVFFAALGAVIERDHDHAMVFAFFGHPQLDIAAARAERIAAGEPDDFGPQDLYSDARPCLAALHHAGFRVGIVGNQPAHREQALRDTHLPADLIATSSTWQATKPAPGFFAKIIDAAGVAPSHIAYVGDRLDNDVLPAVQAGMVSVFLRRGPWGYLHAQRPEVQAAHLRIDSLDELLPALLAFGHLPGAS